MSKLHSHACAIVLKVISINKALTMKRCSRSLHIWKKLLDMCLLMDPRRGRPCIIGNENTESMVNLHRVLIENGHISAPMSMHSISCPRKLTYSKLWK